MDRRVIDFCSLISPELGISHNSTKYLLKNIFNRHLPSNYRLRYKQGFSFDLKRLLKNELKEDFSDTLMSKNLFGNEVIDSNIIHKMVTDFYKEQGTTNEWGLWTLYSLQKMGKASI